MAPNELPDKLVRLKNILENMGSILVALSGGLDSTLLLKAAKDVLGDRVTAATIKSSLIPDREIAAASKIASCLDVNHLIIVINIFEDEKLIANSPRRCYYCKRKIFSELKRTAEEIGLEHIIEGTNYSDNDDYRPGELAKEEFGIESPLKTAYITRDEGRELARILGLPNWNRAPESCLATRLPYGTRITRENLKKIQDAEELLLGQGFKVVRVRDHGVIARIEIGHEDFSFLLHGDLREKVVREFKELGYTYVTFDLEGYRTGSLNELLKKEKEQWKGNRLKNYC